ncbi:hypothetical protein [Streptomyces sp. NPDC057909]
MSQIASASRAVRRSPARGAATFDRFATLLRQAQDGGTLQGSTDG